MDLLLVVSALIVLHNVDGDEIYINPSFIATLHQTQEASKGKPNQLIVGGVNCVIALGNGKFVSVIESCETVRRKMDDALR